MVVRVQLPIAARGDPPDSIASSKPELRRFLIGWSREHYIVVRVLSYLLLPTWTFAVLALFHTSALITPPPSVPPIESPTTILLDLTVLYVLFPDLVLPCEKGRRLNNLRFGMK